MFIGDVGWKRVDYTGVCSHTIELYDISPEQEQALLNYMHAGQTIKIVPDFSQNCATNLKKSLRDLIGDF